MKYFLSLFLMTLLLNNVMAAAEMTYGKPKKGDIVQKVTLSGTIDAKRSSSILTGYNGYIKKIFVKIGDKVKTGDPLVSVSPTLDYNGQVFPLRAPFSGTIVQMAKNEGEYVRENNAEDAIMRVDDLSSLIIKSSIPEVDYSKIQLGLPTTISIQALSDTRYSGKVTSLALSTQKSANWTETQAQFPLIITLDQVPPLARPGMSVLADIVIAEKKNVLMIGQEYVQVEGSGASKKYQVILKGRKTQDIKIGIKDESFVEVISGLKGNEELELKVYE